MPEIEATPSQRAAIENRGCAVLVSAGAGSGKTRVLTERLLRQIEDGRDIDSFLVITFTRAAAAELRGRIMALLAEKAAKDPSNRHLRRQSALCRRAAIQTIDGFCSDLLRQNCHLLGLAPDFRIIEDDRGRKATRIPKRIPASSRWPTRSARDGTTAACASWCSSCTAGCSATPGRTNGPRK